MNFQCETKHAVSRVVIFEADSTAHDRDRTHFVSCAGTIRARFRGRDGFPVAILTQSSGGPPNVGMKVFVIVPPIEVPVFCEPTRPKLVLMVPKLVILVPTPARFSRCPGVS